MMRGLFGKTKGLEGMKLPAMDASLPNEITYTPKAQAIMSGEAPMPAAPQGRGLKDILLAALGGAADGAATFFGGRPLIAENQQFERWAAMRQAEQERQRSMELADYRTKLQIQQEFEQPDVPKPGSFEWYQTATPEQRAAYDTYNPVVATTWQGPTIVPRSSLSRQSGPQIGAVEDGYRFKGGDPSNPSSWEPVAASQAPAQSPMVPFTRQQYEGLVQARGNRAWVDNWMRQNGIRMVD